MNERRKSDRAVVPKKSPNNAQERAAEAVEGRALAKGKTLGSNTPRTQGRTGVPSALERIHEVARKDRQQRFTALLHHVYDVDRLRAAFLAIRRDAAAGDLQLPRLHALLREDEEREVQRPAKDHGEEDGGEAGGGLRRTPQASPYPRPRTRRLPQGGRAGTHAPLRCAPEQPCRERLSASSRHGVVAEPEPSEPTGPCPDGPHGEAPRPLAPADPNLPPVARTATPCQDLRQEPDASIAHVRICGGRGG